MRVGASPYVPMVRRPVVAAGGGTPAAPAPAPAPAPTQTQPAPSPTTGSFDVKAFGMKVQSFFSNLWDTVVGPFLKSLFGMFGG